MGDQQSDKGRTILVVVGVALMVFGAWALAGRSGLVPDWVLRDWSDLQGGVSLILLGGLVIWMSRGGFKTPPAGTRLYRSRDDKWVAGVLGGLARYFAVDATLLRLVFVALVLFGAGWPVGAYILMAILVPKEPADVAAAVPAPASPAAPPAPPAPIEPAAAEPAPPAPAAEAAGPEEASPAPEESAASSQDALEKDA